MSLRRFFKRFFFLLDPTPFLLEIVSENLFSGKTYFYAIAFSAVRAWEGQLQLVPHVHARQNGLGQAACGADADDGHDEGTGEQFATFTFHKSAM